MRTRRLLAFALTVLSFQLSAQKKEFVSPLEIFEQAQVLVDSNRYGDAISLLKTISERDTAYSAAGLKMIHAFIKNDQPDSALQICDKLLLEPSDQKAEFLRMKGMAMASRDYKKGAEFLEGVIKQYPTMPSIRFSAAAAYFDDKQYEKATQHCFRILEMNPYYSSAHVLLGRIAVLQGHKAHAMMAWGMYMGVMPRDNGTLVVLNQLADSQVNGEGSITAFSTNGTSRLDQMIRAKIVMNDDFKSAFPFSVPLVKQFELIFDQLDKITQTSGDEYLKVYLPVYKAIKSNNQMTPFIYHILTSTAIEDVQKWRNKNEKALGEFFKTTNSALAVPRLNLAFPELGFNEKTNTWYDNSNRVAAIGKMENEKRTGPWVYFHDNGEKSAKGLYSNAGEKVGVWKYYYENGKEKSEENMDTGEVTLYSQKGFKAEHFFLKGGKIDGPADTFYSNGQRSSVIPYVAGKRDGKETDYRPNGVIAATYTYTQEKLNGPYEAFHPNGKLRLRTTFKDDYYNGKFDEYFSNGAMKSSGEYSAGVTVGVWKYYFRNGKLSYEGSYTPKGKATGEWTYYDHTGMLTEKRRFDNEGRYDGDRIAYDDGKQLYVWGYKKDLLIKHTSFKPDGKIIFTAGNNNGTFAAKIYDRDGILLREGKYVEGKADGLWKYYTRHGVVEREYNYKDDELHGMAISYHPTGEKLSEINYEAGKQNGRYVRYARHGQVEQEGWYVDGNPEQRWLSYYSDGTLQFDDYFIEGDKVGLAYQFAPDGKLYMKSVSNREAVLDPVFFDSKGKESSVKRVEGPKEIYEQFFSNSKLKSREETMSGNSYNHRTSYFPDGSVHFDYEMLLNERHGKYVYYHPNGKPSIKGQYEDGERQGVWERYHFNGQLYSVGKYFDDQLDSVWTYYHDNGTVSSRGPWKNSEKHGSFIYYSPDGKTVVEKKFVHNDLVAYRSLTGAMPGEWVAFTGNQTIDLTFPDGKPAWHQEYKNGLSNGVVREYYSNGVLYEENRYVNGDLEGDQKSYYQNGKLKQIEQYKFDDANGTDDYYDEEGNLIYTSQYKVGHLHGKFQLFEKGKKVKEYNFWYGTAE